MIAAPKIDKTRETLEYILSDIAQLDASEFSGVGGFIFAGPNEPHLPNAEELLAYWQEYYSKFIHYFPPQQIDGFQEIDAADMAFPMELWEITNNPATIVFLLFHLPALHVANDLTVLLTHCYSRDRNGIPDEKRPPESATASLDTVLSDFRIIAAMDVSKDEKEHLLHRLATTPAAVRKQGVNYRDPEAFMSAIVDHATQYPNADMGQVLVQYHKEAYTPAQYESDRRILRQLACSKATEALKQDNFSVDQLRIIAAADPDLPVLTAWALDAAQRIPAAQREHYRTFLRHMFTETRDDTRLTATAEKLKPLFAEHGERMYKLFTYNYGESFYEGLEELVDTVTSAGCSFATPHATISFPVGTKRRREAVAGISAKVQQEADSIYRLFEQMYDLRSRPWARETTAREKAQLMVMGWWNETFQDKLNRHILHWFSEARDSSWGYRVSDEVEFPFDSFFQSVGDDYLKALAAAVASHDDTYASKMSDFLKRVQQERWWAHTPKQEDSYLFENFTSELNRIRIGLEFPVNFDEVRIEFNPTALDDIVNSTAECTSQGGRFEQYGHSQARDHQVGILGINLSVQGAYWDTVGKAFLFRMSDAERPSEREGRILYVDGVVMEETVADILALSVPPDEENPWMPLCTKAILLTAIHGGFDDVLVTTSYRSAQWAEWEYVRHTATLAGLQEFLDFSYSARRSIQATDSRQTVLQKGFQFFDGVRSKPHHLRRVIDGSYEGLHVLEGLWPSEDAARSGKDPESNQFPQVNDGNGYVIGIRRPVQEWRERFNERYGEVYGKI